MKKSHLVSCVGCARHVRANEVECPFCRAALPRSQRAAPPPRPPAMRLGRAALLALGTGAATIATACGGNVVEGDRHTTVDDGGDGDSGAYDAGFIGVAAYGGVSPEDAGIDELDSQASMDSVAPPPVDASNPADVTSPPPFDGGSAPPYGQPPTPPDPPDDAPGG